MCTTRVHYVTRLSVFSSLISDVADTTGTTGARGEQPLWLILSLSLTPHQHLVECQARRERDVVREAFQIER